MGLGRRTIESMAWRKDCKSVKMSLEYTLADHATR